MLTIVDAHVSFNSHELAQPLHLSSGTINVLTAAHATVTVELGAQRATGHGAIYLSDLWAWPSDGLSHEDRDTALRRLCESIAAELPAHFRQHPLHPLEIGLQIHDLACNMPAEGNPPALARILCGSPFDAALHDAAGRALDRSAFALYDAPTAIPSADGYFPGQGACRAIRSILQPPRRQLPAWYVVSTDDFTATLQAAIRNRGYQHFKVKISGRDIAADVHRTIEVYRVAHSEGVAAPQITVDSNEANPTAASVLEYLERLQATHAQAYTSLAYLEQPTSRDIRRHAFDWRPVAARKPVLLDEGLTDLTLLDESRRQGYSGFALKTCKGHSSLLVCAAWARQHGMCIALQDLTNPGIALIHGALVGSYLPTINGAELNSPQFTPAANAEFLACYRELFEPSSGIHTLPSISQIGLSFDEMTN